MSKMTKKIASVGLAVTTTVWLMGASFVPTASAQAVTIETLLAQIQALTAQLNALKGPVTAGTSSYTFTRNLTVGSKGADVSALQQTLIDGGYLKVVSAPTAFFGPATKTALVKWQTAAGVTPASGYFGPKSRAALVTATPGPTPGPGPTPVPGTGLALSIASDNPSAQTVPLGATGVTFLKFNVAGNGTLNSLTFKRVGIGSRNDFGSNGVYLYDGNMRLTSGKTINSTTHEVQFINLNLAVSGVKTITLVADIASGATAANINAFQLVSGTGSVDVTGALTGNNMTIGGQVVGGVVINDGASPTNPKIGEVGAKVFEFTLTASSTEDIVINRISLTEGGTIANENLKNFALKNAGNTLATAASIGAKDLVTLVLATPFKIEKGQQKTFELFADLTGSARSADTIVFYVDSTSDVAGTGLTYGYPILPTISDVDTTSESDTLTVQGGPITITFNGPVAGDIALRGQDVTLFDFTIAAQNNIEIKNLRINVSTTGLTSGDGFNDVKVWDTVANAVVTSAQDVTTSTELTLTDVINVSANATKRFKVTADVDADDEAGDNVRITLAAFQSGDIKNLDNNTNVTISSDVSPSTNLVGNVFTVAAPTLTVGLSALPSSKTYVQGVNGKDLAGFTFKATAGDIRLDTVKITAATTTGTLNSSEVTSLALYDSAGTKVSDIKSLDSSALTATFTGLNLTVKQGEQKILTLRGNISTNATNADVYYFYIASNTTDDITAYDKDGNSATLAGVAANSGNSVTITITTVGDVTVAAAPSDSETQADIVLANGSLQTLAKFIFSATNEDMTIQKLAIKVSSSSDATGTSTTSGDEVPYVRLYDGATLLGSGSYYPAISGASSSIVMIDDLNWIIPKDTNKILTVKGYVSTISDGADTGASVYASIMASGFKATGASSNDASISAALGNQKVVYKTKPSFSLPTQQNTGNGALTTGAAIKALRFRVSADANGAVSWKTIQFQVAMTNASMSAASTSNIAVRNVSTGSSLTLATVYSGTVVDGASTNSISNTTGYVFAEVTTPEYIAAGGYQDYDLELTFSATHGTNANDSQAVVKLYRQETSTISASFFSAAAGSTSATDPNPSFIWSDQSQVGMYNSPSSTDWFNGVFVKPSLFTDISNILRD